MARLNYALARVQAFPIEMHTDPIQAVAGDTGVGQPKSQEIIDLLKGTFHRQAQDRTIKACALAYDIRTIPPGQTQGKRKLMLSGFYPTMLSGPRMTGSVSSFRRLGGLTKCFEGLSFTSPEKRES